VNRAFIPFSSRTCGWKRVKLEGATLCTFREEMTLSSPKSGNANPVKPKPSIAKPNGQSGV